MVMMLVKSINVIQSIQRAINILNCFNQNELELSLNVISEEFKKSFDSAYNKGFRAGLNLYMEKKEPLKKDALELLMDELKLNESLRSIELETIDVQDNSEPEICSELYYGKPESVQYDECEVDSEPDNIISAVPPIDSTL